MADLLIAEKDIPRLARRIADYLFTDGGNGIKAERLVMRLKDGRDGAGWAERPMAQRIEELLRDFG